MEPSTGLASRSAGAARDRLVLRSPPSHSSEPSTDEPPRPPPAPSHAGGPRGVAPGPRRRPHGDRLVVALRRAPGSPGTARLKQSRVGVTRPLESARPNISNLQYLKRTVPPVPAVPTRLPGTPPTRLTANPVPPMAAVTALTPPLDAHHAMPEVRQLAVPPVPAVPARRRPRRPRKQALPSAPATPARTRPGGDSATRVGVTPGTGCAAGATRRPSRTT
jgi:hypothetical protein